MPTVIAPEVQQIVDQLMYGKDPRPLLRAIEDNLRENAIKWTTRANPTSATKAQANKYYRLAKHVSDAALNCEMLMNNGSAVGLLPRKQA
jgi:hypothetical protein